MKSSYLSSPAARLTKQRDLTLLGANEIQYLVVACDSDGGIGGKPQDFVKATEEMAGVFAVRVPLFEILACGAEPFLVIDCLSVEMEGSGEKIVEAIKGYSRRAGITQEVQFTGSTEENVPTIQTGIGVTVLGIVDKERFSPGTSQAGDAVVCTGVPKSGPRYRLTLEDPEMLRIEDLVKLRSFSWVKDILPVGSKGVLQEAHQLARSASLAFAPKKDAGVDLNQSAGPSTCVVFSVSPDRVHQACAALEAPAEEIGALEQGAGIEL